MKIFSSLILAVFFTGQAFGGEIWVASVAPSRPGELRAIASRLRLQITEKDFISSYDVLLGHPVSSTVMTQILEIETLARTASLRGQFKDALKGYTKLETLLEGVPDVAGLEKIMLSTKVNRAQLATLLKINDGDALWREAHAWCPKAKLTTEEFPPSVVLRFGKTRPERKNKLVKIKVESAASVFIDGQSVDKDLGSEGIYSKRLEPGHHQVSALVPGYEWSSVNFIVPGHGPSIQKVSVPSSPLAQGSCDSPQMTQNNGTHLSLVVAFENQCLRAYDGHHWYSLDGQRILPSNLKPEIAESGQASVAPLPQRSFFGELTRSGWFWAGVGTVVLTAVIISSSNSTTTIPTHTMQ